VYVFPHGVWEMCWFVLFCVALLVYGAFVCVSVCVSVLNVYLCVCPVHLSVC